MEVGTAPGLCAFVTHTLPGPKQAPNPTHFCKWNVETPYCSLLGTAGCKVCLWRCGNRIEEKANAAL